MNLSRRDFLKGIGAAGLAMVLGKPIYEPLLRQEIVLTAKIDGDLTKYLEWGSFHTVTGTTYQAVISIDPGWIQDCVTITDQYNRRWKIVGHFDALKSPEGWEFSLDRNNS